MSAMREPGEEPRIRMVGVGKTYGAKQIFSRVDLTIGNREVVAIVGPSGCGKTTLLRCIDGLIPVSEGDVYVEGERVEKPIAGVAMVFQHFGLFPWQTVWENVAYGLKLAGATRAELRDRVSHFIEMVGLKGFEQYYPYQISGGMQQRCGLARALAVGPRVLLMDEPFGAVDAQTREVLQFELLKIWEVRPTTMAFVTHSIEEAVLMGDRVVLLKGSPSTIEEIVDIDLPRPRTRQTLAHPRFVQLREHVWNALMEDVKRADQQLVVT